MRNVLFERPLSKIFLKALKNIFRGYLNIIWKALLLGSLFAPSGYYDLTPTEEEDFEMTELFPMLRSDAENNARKTQNKTMVDSLTSDLAVSVTSEDLADQRTIYQTETDNILSKKPLLNLTHIDDEVSYVDE